MPVAAPGRAPRIARQDPANALAGARGRVRTQASAPRAVETSLVLTPAGRVLLPFAIAGAVLSWAAGGAAGLLAAAAPGLFAVSALASWAQARAVVPRPCRRRRAFAGVPVVLEVPFENRSSWLPVLDAVVAHGGQRGARPAGLLGLLRPREVRPLALGVRFGRRGRRRHLTVAVATSFPFGLVTCRRVHRLPCDLLVVPVPGELEDEAPPRGTASAAPVRRRAPDAGDEDLWAVREWREGESLRRMHWPLTLRRGRRVVRELRQRTDPPVHVVLVAAEEADPLDLGAVAGTPGTDSRGIPAEPGSPATPTGHALAHDPVRVAVDDPASSPGPGSSSGSTSGSEPDRARDPGQRSQRSPRPRASRGRGEAFERAVRAAAAVLAQALAADGVAWLSVAARPGTTRPLGPLRGRRGLVGALEVLAEVRRVALGPGEAAAAVAAAWAGGPRGARRVLVGAGSRRRPLARLAPPGGARVVDVGVAAPGEGLAPWSRRGSGSGRADGVERLDGFELEGLA